jgi:hypothetical protein
VQLFGGGCIMLQVQRAAEILKERYGVTSDIWGVTSYQLEQGVSPTSCTQLRFEVRSHAWSNPWRRKKAKEEADADEPSQRSLGSRLGLPRHAA